MDAVDGESLQAAVSSQHGGIAKAMQQREDWGKLSEKESLYGTTVEDI